MAWAGPTKRVDPPPPTVLRFGHAPRPAGRLGPPSRVQRAEEERQRCGARRRRNRSCTPGSGGATRGSARAERFNGARRRGPPHGTSSPGQRLHQQGGGQRPRMCSGWLRRARVRRRCLEGLANVSRSRGLQGRGRRHPLRPGQPGRERRLRRGSAPHCTDAHSLLSCQNGKWVASMCVPPGKCAPNAKNGAAGCK